MSESQNPYAPPQASLEPRFQDGSGPWRDGQIVVQRAGCAYPGRCVKCNAPAELPKKPRKIYWHHPAIYIAVFAGPFIYAIVAFAVRKQAEVLLGLCPSHRKRRIWAIAGGWGGFLLGFVLMIVSIGARLPLLGVLSMLFMVGSLIAGIVISRTVYPVRIDKEWVRLKGCSEAFLASLPPFPG